MSAAYKSNIPTAKQVIHQSMIEGLNAAAEAHVGEAQESCPVEKGNLQASIRQEQEATEGKPEAVVVAGGVEINGVVVDYAEPVNDGHATRSGSRVPGTFFMDKGIEVGIQEAERGGNKVRARLQGISTARTF